MTQRPVVGAVLGIDFFTRRSTVTTTTRALEVRIAEVARAHGHAFPVVREIHNPGVGDATRVLRSALTGTDQHIKGNTFAMQPMQLESALRQTIDYQNGLQSMIASMANLLKVG